MEILHHNLNIFVCVSVSNVEERDVQWNTFAHCKSVFKIIYV